MSHRQFAKTLALVAVIYIAFVAAVAVTCAQAQDIGARPVSLRQADAPPSQLSLLRPGRHVDFGHGGKSNYTCQRGFFSDISAYRWNGNALGAQQWDPRNLVYYWLDRRHGGEVVYDGTTFWNHTHRAVLVAGWCG